MKWIISNHKNALLDELLIDYLNRINEIKTNNVNLVICPKDNHLKYFTSFNYQLGCQDIGLPYSKLKEYNVHYSIIGHNDKRKNYHETDEIINIKINELLKNKIIPILCIGEEKEDDLKETLKKELTKGLKGIKENIIIAYEPVWAIGSGKIPNIDTLNEIISFIKEEVIKIINKTPIVLYGGSVNRKTIKFLEQVESLDGYLIGTASINVEELKELIEVVK